MNQLAATLQVYQEGDTRTEEYEYDAEGNRTFARLQLVRTLQYHYEYYPNSNRLKSDGKYEYTYDANGNLVAKEKIRCNPFEPEEKWEYTYDLLNRLVKVVKNGSVVAEYGYDPEGYRVVKKARGETTHYVFEGTEPIFEKRIFAEGRTAVRSYVYVLGRHLARVDGVIGDPEAPVYFYHTDHLGSIRAVTDRTGEVVWNADYFAFGTRYGTSEGPGFEEWHGFTGKEYDPDTGLYYFNARWYDAELGRFISEDPVMDPNNPNLCVYGRNNPLRFFDPSGLFSNEIEAIIDPKAEIISIGTLGVVEVDDSLESIAEEKYGDPNLVNIIIAANGLNPENPVIEPGQILYIPDISLINDEEGNFLGYSFVGVINPEAPLEYNKQYLSYKYNEGINSNSGWSRKYANFGPHTGNIKNSGDELYLLAGAYTIKGISSVVWRSQWVQKLITNDTAKIAQTTVLGKWQDIQQLKGSYNMLNINPKVFKVLELFGKGWEVNRMWLDRCIARGDTFYLASNPQMWLGGNSYFSKELTYMLSKGYQIIGNYLVKP